MDLTLRNTSGRRVFKELTGATNHFLITILIGLDGVEKGTVCKAPEFSTSWNAKDPSASARRSREFALSSGLAWVVDALDSYFISLRRVPSVVENASVRRAFDGAGRSVTNRLNLMLDSFLVQRERAELSRLAIAWRNVLVHSFSDDQFCDSARTYLTSQGPALHAGFRGLDIAVLLNRFDRREAPSFKEALSLISALHLLVSELDERLLSQLDPLRFFSDALHLYLAQDPIGRAQNVWGKGDDKARKTLRVLLSQAGFSPADDLVRPRVTADDIDAIAQLSPKEACARFVSGYTVA